MQEVEKVLGHEEVIRHLQNAVERNRFHILIFLQEKKEAVKNFWQNYLP